MTAAAMRSPQAEVIGKRIEDGRPQYLLRPAGVRLDCGIWVDAGAINPADLDPASRRDLYGPRDPFAAMSRAVDLWADFIAAVERTKELARKAIAASDAAMAEINADRAARGLPPVGEG